MTRAGRRVRLTRRVRFSAAHRYWRADWTEEQNRARFGENVHLHGHNYVLEAQFEGAVDPETGMAVDLGAIDARLGELGLRFGYRDLSDAPELGGRIPTTENLALAAWTELSAVAGLGRLVLVRLYESPELFVEVSE